MSPLNDLAPTFECPQCRAALPTNLTTGFMTRWTRIVCPNCGQSLAGADLMEGRCSPQVATETDNVPQAPQQELRGQLMVLSLQIPVYVFTYLFMFFLAQWLGGVSLTSGKYFGYACVIPFVLVLCWQHEKIAELAPALAKLPQAPAFKAVPWLPMLISVVGLGMTIPIVVMFFQVKHRLLGGSQDAEASAQNYLFWLSFGISWLIILLKRVFRRTG
jgi:hypothetical protein